MKCISNKSSLISANNQKSRGGQRKIWQTLSKRKVLSICLLAIFWTAQTSLLFSLQEITTGVCILASSSLNGLLNRSKKKTNKSPKTFIYLLPQKKIQKMPRTPKSWVNPRTCIEQWPAHWHLSLCLAFHWNSPPRIADLSPPYHSNAASAMGISAPYLLRHCRLRLRLRLFSVKPPSFHSNLTLQISLLQLINGIINDFLYPPVLLCKWVDLKSVKSITFFQICKIRPQIAAKSEQNAENLQLLNEAKKKMLK